MKKNYQYDNLGNNERENKKRQWHELDAKLGLIILIPLVAFLFTLLMFQAYRINGISMQKTLYDQNVVIVNRFTKTLSSVLNKTYVPDRYDMVLLKPDTLQSSDTLIKRVIALPGERIVIRNGTVTVFNKSNPKGIKIDEQAPPEAEVQGFTEGQYDLVLGEGEVFVLGDNRENSIDSRVFGAVDTKHVIGTAFIRIYPFDDINLY